MISSKLRVLKSPNASLIQKVSALFQSSVYIADNMADFLENAPYLPSPFYKRLPFATICIHNVHLSRNKDKSRHPRFLLYDESGGQESMSWLTYDSLGKEAGIEEEDFVNALYFRYYTREKYSEIITAFKGEFKPRERKKRETSLSVRLKEILFPDLAPEPRHAF